MRARVRDRIPQGMVELLKTDAFGTVTEFRTVDGKGIGVIVELSDGPALVLRRRNRRG